MNETKEYLDFLEKLAASMEEQYAGKMTAQITSTVKNNGVVMQGLMLKEEGEQVAPNYYLEHMFQEWKQGIRTMEEIHAGICNSYEEEKKKNRTAFTEIRFAWEEFQQNVYMRLINRERNREQLEEIPHRDFLDMTLVYYYSLTISNEVVGTILIKKEHLQLLGITEEELYEVAEKNTRLFRPVRFYQMKEILHQLGESLGVSMEPEVNDAMYVLSNVSHMFGAVSMTFESELRQFSERIGCGFFILPSSIHEVILVPDREEYDPDYFATMVRETNRDYVQLTEVLSDSVYFFDRNTMAVRRIR